MPASNYTFYPSTDGDLFSFCILFVFQSLIGMFNLQRICKIHLMYQSLKVNLAKII